MDISKLGNQIKFLIYFHEVGYIVLLRWLFLQAWPGCIFFGGMALRQVAHVDEIKIKPCHVTELELPYVPVSRHGVTI